MGAVAGLRWMQRLRGYQYQSKWQNQRSLPLLLIGGLVLAVGTAGLTSYWILRHLILNGQKEAALMRVERAGADTDEWLARLIVQVDAIANTPEVRSLNWRKAEPYLQLELHRSPDFHMFVMARADGSYYTTRSGRADANLKDRRHFQRALTGKKLVDDPVVSRTTGIRQVNIAVPIWSVPPLYRTPLDADQQQVRSRSLAALNLPMDPERRAYPIGELAGPVPLERIATVVAETHLGEGSYAFALDSQGIPIAHPDPTIMEPQKSLTESEDATLAAIAGAMVRGQEGIQLVKLRGDWVYVAYAPLNNADWSLGLVIPRENLENSLYPLNLLAAALGGLLLVAALIAMRQLRLLEKAQVHASRETLLNCLTDRIRASLDLQTILQTTVNEVAAVIDLDRAHFSWYIPETRQLEIVCEHSRESLPSQVSTLDLSSFGELGDRFRRGEMLQVDHVFSTAVDRNVADFCQRLNASSYLALPVLVQAETSGYLTCIRNERGAWSGDEVRLLQALADQLAIAIHQSRLHTQTTQQVILLSDQAECLNRTLNELKNTQSQLIQSEKMSSLGQLVAGVAHEINNPVNFIYGNLTHADSYTQELLHVLNLYRDRVPVVDAELQEELEQLDLDFLSEDLPKLLSSMKIGADRIRQIVLSLRNFSRLDQADMKPVDIHEGIDSTLLILQNRLKAGADGQSILVLKEYGELPEVECYAGQLNQVFMNILSNGIDALAQKFNGTMNGQIPTILIRTEQKGNHVIVHIQDNGPGITKDVQKRLFDPFFTTKPIGKGTGLGLSISYQIIVEKHGGVLKCISEPGQGAEFWIEIPVKQHTVSHSAKEL